MTRFLLRLSVLVLGAGAIVSADLAHAQEVNAREMWISNARLASLPTSGSAWESLLEEAQRSTSSPDLSNQDDRTNVTVLAKALVYARLREGRYRNEVVEAIRTAMGTVGGRTLALGRELAAYVISADLVGLPADLDQQFRVFLGEVRNRTLSDHTLISTHEDRPNNWGTHAGASRIAIALYLGDDRDLQRAANVFRGWLGDRASYSEFKYGALDWQADPERPVGINPKGATKEGHLIDGALPEEMRRAGGFRWPPPKENYAYEGLQGALGQAVLLHNAGYDVWSWEDRALLRAFWFLHEQADFPAEGDDTWQPHVINHFYGASLPAPVPARPGKNLGWTDWTLGPDAGPSDRPEPTPPDPPFLLD